MPIEVTITAQNKRYESGDDRWSRQVLGLHQELSNEVGPLSLDHQPVPGAKGAVDQVILALGSAGAVTAAVQCFQAWLRRDRSRTLELTWTEDGVEKKLTVTGEALDGRPFTALAEAVAARITDQQ